MVMSGEADYIMHVHVFFNIDLVFKWRICFLFATIGIVYPNLNRYNSFKENFTHSKKKIN